MSRTHAKLAITLALIGLLPAVAAAETPFFFSTGDPDGKIATATRPDAGGVFEIESADDFVLTHSTSISSATFTGLVPTGATVGEVVVEIYRVFPKDSDISRTSGPPTFSTPQVPTRVNSPSDVAFDSRDSSGSLSFSTNVLSASFTALNSVTPGGVHPAPGFQTGGNGPATGEEVEFSVTFATPFVLPADHYFFVPQVELDDGAFLWLSAPKPIVPPGTPFLPDLQSWTRDAALDPDWLRIGTDIVGPPVTGAPAPTFNETFSLTGAVVPEPSTWAMMLLGFAGLGFAGYCRTRKARPARA
jgi:hypothetical protein